MKKIAVIKQLKGGFSADGGAISGLVKLETYAGYLKVEVSLINFAPLNEGRYVFGVSDGENVVVFEDVLFECESRLNCQNGFAFAVCFCRGEASPIATAYCGQANGFLPSLIQEMQSREQVSPKKSGGAAYDDEAISEVNYYEDRADKDGEPLFQNKEEEKLQIPGGEDEKAVRPVKIAQGGGQDGLNGKAVIEHSADGMAGVERNADAEAKAEQSSDAEVGIGQSANAEARAEQSSQDLSGGLAGGDFYSRMRPDIEKIFATYPKDSDLEEVLQGSRFVKIEYGNGQYYAFGVLYVGGNAAYVCYGVPSLNGREPPKSLKGFSSYIPCKNGGYWLTYQDARTGVSVDIELT